MEVKDFSQYPEGFNEIKEMFTNLPNDQMKAMFTNVFMTMLLTL
jgi:hypothetical protein